MMEILEGSTSCATQYPLPRRVIWTIACIINIATRSGSMAAIALKVALSELNNVEEFDA